MAENLEIDSSDQRVMWSDRPIITDERGRIDGELVILASELVDNYNGDCGQHLEQVVRQIPSNIILGEN